MFREFWLGYGMTHWVFNWLHCPIFDQHIAAIDSNNLPIMFAEHLAECRAHASTIPNFAPRKWSISGEFIQIQIWKQRGSKKIMHCILKWLFQPGYKKTMTALLEYVRPDSNRKLWKIVAAFTQALAGQASEELQRLQTVPGMNIRRRWSVWGCIWDTFGTNSSYVWLLPFWGQYFGAGKHWAQPGVLKSCNVWWNLDWPQLKIIKTKIITSPSWQDIPTWQIENWSHDSMSRRLRPKGLAWVLLHSACWSRQDTMLTHCRQNMGYIFPSSKYEHSVGSLVWLYWPPRLADDLWTIIITTIHWGG